MSFISDIADAILRIDANNKFTVRGQNADTVEAGSQSTVELCD